MGQSTRRNGRPGLVCFLSDGADRLRQGPWEAGRVRSCRGGVIGDECVRDGVQIGDEGVKDVESRLCSVNLPQDCEVRSRGRKASQRSWAGKEKGL